MRNLNIPDENGTVQQKQPLYKTVSVVFYPRNSQYDEVIKWKHFPRYWPFVRGEFTGDRASDAELWCFLLSAPE